jgi:hypothetical protein
VSGDEGKWRSGEVEKWGSGVQGMEMGCGGDMPKINPGSSRLLQTRALYAKKEIIQSATMAVCGDSLSH